MAQKIQEKSTEYPSTLWLTNSGKPVTAQGIQKALREAREKIRELPGHKSFPNVTPHCLRRTFAFIDESYAKARGLTLDVTDKSGMLAIHQFITEALGHKTLKQPSAILTPSHE